jgi:hypothetical protein
MLLDAWVNGGMRSRDDYNVQPWLIRSVTNSLAMANACSLRLALSPTKLPKDEIGDRQQRFRAAGMTKGSLEHPIFSSPCYENYRRLLPIPTAQLAIAAGWCICGINKASFAQGRAGPWRHL